MFIFLFSCQTASQLTQKEINKSITLGETQYIIEYLSSDKMEGRHPNQNGFKKASNFVTQYLSANNVKPFYNFYEDSLQIYGTHSWNIVGLIGDRAKTKSHILIGAHLDHLGTKKVSGASIYNGANDNASGVTAVLQMAKLLSQKKFKSNIIIALFTGEEDGLLGSKHLAKKFKILLAASTTTT